MVLDYEGSGRCPLASSSSREAERHRVSLWVAKALLAADLRRVLAIARADNVDDPISYHLPPGRKQR